MYLTFGQNHYHKVGGLVFDNYCVAIINCNNESEGRDIAFEMFGPKWCFSYMENEFNFDSMHFFPRGFVELNKISEETD